MQRLQKNGRNNLRVHKNEQLEKERVTPIEAHSQGKIIDEIRTLVRVRIATLTTCLFLCYHFIIILYLLNQTLLSISHSTSSSFSLSYMKGSESSVSIPQTIPSVAVARLAVSLLIASVATPPEAVDFLVF